MKLSLLTRFLEDIAPLSYQEGYDNSGLIHGKPEMEVQGALISLDCTEAIVDEAIRSGLNLIISHHPIVFKGLKKFNGRSYVERVIMKAIKHDIAIYAIHTNFDNVFNGVNAKICEKLGIRDFQILEPKAGLLKKLVTYVPHNYAGKVRKALFDTGAGKVGNYSSCSYNLEGTGTFKAEEGADPFVGEIGELHQEPETRIEVVYPGNIERQLVAALIQAHPYEEVAYDMFALGNSFEVGSGMIGNLAQEMNELDFLHMVKDVLNARVIRHTHLLGRKVRRVAVCGGAGSFLLQRAISAGADVFVTADYKYHEFFDAEDKIVISDVGHFESEQFTSELLFEIITKKFPNFALRLTSIDTNPINYII